jgi:1-acyl-sn-glycerol-3-phosphate acyltransferase
MRHRLAWRVGPGSIRIAARLMWRLRIEHEAPFPKPPFIIAANHLSFLDPPLVASAWGRRVRFITLADLFGNYPLLDFTLESFEAIRVRRGTVPLAAIRQSLAHLAHGGVLCLFPEGTRAPKWGEVPPLPGAAWLAVKAGVPIVAVAAIGTDRVLGIDNKLHRAHPLSAGRRSTRGRRSHGEMVGMDRRSDPQRNRGDWTCLSA